MEIVLRNNWEGNTNVYLERRNVYCASVLAIYLESNIFFGVLSYKVLSTKIIKNYSQ